MEGFPGKGQGRQSVLARAVNAMVRAMGGGSVQLRIPTAVPGLQRELGMAAQLSEEMEVGPVVVRELERKNGRAGVQVLISSGVLQPHLDARGETSGLALLKQVESIAYGERVFSVTDVNAETFGGLEYMWRLSGME
jgi:hypothetical protein